MPGVTTALRAEVATIVNHIPNDDLAIQWDLAGENRAVEQALEQGGLVPRRLQLDVYASLRLRCAA